jgi:oxygen-dependent protoporphyrinogen oxidase
MNSSHRTAVVVGAGISGLSCAYRLKASGVDVLLLERGTGVGGVIRSELIDGFLIERGPNSSQGTEELLRLVDELGISQDLIEGDPKAPAYVCFGGRLHVVPSNPRSFLASKLLSATGKIRLLAEPLIPARRDSSEESVYSFARRRIGRQAAERLVAPFVSGIFAGDASRLSVQAAFPKLAALEATYGGLIKGSLAKAREARRGNQQEEAAIKASPARRRLVSFKTGMAHLPATLARSLGEDLMTGVEDCRVVYSPSGNDSAAEISGIEFTRGGNREKLTADNLIIATPAEAAASLVEPLSEELCRLLGEIPYAKLAIVHLSYDEASIKRRLDGFGFLVAPGEALSILGCVWNSSLFVGRAPRGSALLTVFVGGARNPSLVDLPDGDLTEMVHADLRRVLSIDGDPKLVAVTRYERAIPQYTLGHARRVERIDRLVRSIGGLRLIGNYLHGVSTGDCIKEGERVAREIAGEGGATAG